MDHSLDYTKSPYPSHRETRVQNPGSSGGVTTRAQARALLKRTVGSGSPLPDTAGLRQHKIQKLKTPSSNTAEARHQAFDCLFLSSDKEVQALLARLSDSPDNSEVILMSQPDGLERDNLVNRLTIQADGTTESRPGKLFENGSPLTLVLDVRNMNSADISQFNDLLDPVTPCLYDKREKKKIPLASHVRIVLLVNPQQLPKGGTATDNLPGGDFWRRINRPDNSWEVTGQQAVSAMETAPPETMTAPAADSQAMDIDPVTINLHFHPDWRRVLAGGPGVNARGRICHMPGMLETLQPGQTLILKGVRPQDLELHQYLKQLQSRQQYESNGKTCQLPANIGFIMAETNENELSELVGAVDRVDSWPQNPIIINGTNLNQWLRPVRINDDGLCIPNTSLLEQLREGGTITITSSLDKHAWYLLLGQLQAINEQTGIKPPFYFALPEEPPGLVPGQSQTTAQPQHPPASQQLQALTYTGESQATQWLASQSPRPFVVQVNEQTRLWQLFDNLHVQSEKTPLFGRSLTSLQQALNSGTPVVFRGLETNPALLQSLETLCSNPPALIINGQLQKYPRADISLLWEGSHQCESPLWSKVIGAATECQEKSIWEQAEKDHGLPPGALPIESIKALYFAGETIPQTITGVKLPGLTRGLLDNLIIAAHQARELDRAPALEPGHWRKAIDSVLTHASRCHPEAREFLKFACERLIPDTENTEWVDPDRLARILGSARPLDQQFIESHFWELARAFGPGLIQKLELDFNNPELVFSSSNAKSVMCALVAAHAPDFIPDEVRNRLNPDPQLLQTFKNLPVRSRIREKRLEDALFSGWAINPELTQQRSKLVRDLAGIARSLSANDSPDTSGRTEALVKKLEQCLVWQGAGVAPLQSLAEELISGDTSQADREQRRLKRLRARLAQSPVVFIQGGTGAGKSYFSARMAEQAGKHFIVSIGPLTEESDLAQRWTWQQDSLSNDRRMELQKRILRQWAETEPGNGEEYVTLIMDEANLAQDGLLTGLKGLWETPPCIYIGGQPVPVSARHRVIFTGNPGSYAGRKTAPALLPDLQQACYPPLDRAFLRDRVIGPALHGQLSRHLPGQAEALTGQATGSLLRLWEQYQAVLPDHEFTPRDLTDACAWVGWYLQQLAESPGFSGITGEQMNAIIWQSLINVLGHEMSARENDRLIALDSWFCARFPTDSRALATVTQQQQLMEFNYLQQAARQQAPDFDTGSSAVAELVQALNQDLSRCQQAWQRQEQHGGRQATLIEGPTGRGKDKTLQLTLEAFKKRVQEKNEQMPDIHYLNACDCSWDELRGHIQRARSAGGILVISEMNLIESQYLEGELNDILAGDAHPGFHLFATTNPVEYTARNPLSPALKGRFRIIPIREYSQAELRGIAEKMAGETFSGSSGSGNPTVAARLADWHCRLRHELRLRGVAMQPASGDLQRLVRDACRAGATKEKELLDLFSKHYWLYLKSAQASAQSLLAKDQAVTHGSALDRPLTQWLNQTVDCLEQPWLVRRGAVASLNLPKCEITVPDHLDEQEARVETIKRIASQKWLQNGMPLEPDQWEDTLTQSVYRLWQRHWFNRYFKGADIRPEQVFPVLNEAQEQTLGLATNQRILAEAGALMETMAYDGVQDWPDHWRAIKRVLNTPVFSESSEPELSDEHSGHPENIRQLDGKTNYEHQDKKERACQIKFKSDRHPSTYRSSVERLRMTRDGKVQRVQSTKEACGEEVVIPGRLPVGETITLGEGQTLGKENMLIAFGSSGKCQLVGLDAGETLASIRIRPETDFHLVRDRYSGLHIISFPKLTGLNIFTVDYVLTRPDTDKLEKTGSCRVQEPCPEPVKQAVEHLLQLSGTGQLPAQQQWQLQAIQQAGDQQARVEAIATYCSNFQGQERYSETGEGNLLQFLLVKRQGACRHRVVAFIALCQYYGIPARSVGNDLHSFPEYSLNDRESWVATDLGGAPGVSVPVGSIKFQPTTTGKTADAATLRALKNLSPEQLKTMAEAMGCSPEQLQQFIQCGTALPTEDSSSELVEKLWKLGSLPGLKTGFDMLRARDSLDVYERSLVNKPLNTTMTGQSKAITYKITAKGKSFFHTLRLSAGDAPYYLQNLYGYDNFKEEKVEPEVPSLLNSKESTEALQEMRQFFQAMIEAGKLEPSYRSSAIRKLLKKTCCFNAPIPPNIISLAKEAFEKDWLQEPQSKKYYQLLERLETIDELKPLVRKAQRDWYLNNFRELDASRLLHIHSMSTSCQADTHQGKSKYLEFAIKMPALSSSWTDEPEGIPDIERLLNGKPAFKKVSASEATHRPVIVLSRPIHLHQRCIGREVENLLKIHLQQHPQDSTLFESRQNRLLSYDEIERSQKIRSACHNAVEDAFCQYLYQITNSKKGKLSVCWTSYKSLRSSKAYGTFTPGSAAELKDIMAHTETTMALDSQHLKKALKTPDALIVTPEMMQVIFREFYETINLDSLYDEVQQRLRED